MLFLFILIIVVIVIVAASNVDNKSSYSRSSYGRAYDYDDDDEDFEREMFDDDEGIHDTGEIFNRFQDGNCSKSDMELLMEDDDIRNEFYDDF